MTWTLTITGLLPMSMNERENAHFMVRWKEKNTITNILGQEALFHRVPPATGRRSVQVVIHKSTRSRVTDDPANRDARAKSILDALVRLGLLHDDDDTNLHWLGVVEGEKWAKKGVEVIISEAAA